MTRHTTREKTRRELLQGVVGASVMTGLTGYADYHRAEYGGVRGEQTYHTLATDDDRLGPVTPRDTLYQIIVDRFYDGDTSLNDFDDFNSDL